MKRIFWFMEEDAMDELALNILDIAYNSMRQGNAHSNSY